MRCTVGLLAALIFGGISLTVFAHDQPPAPPRKPSSGVYVVLRESIKEKDVLPLKEGEMLVINRHRYLKKDDSEPPLYVVVRSAPDVDLDLADKPKAEKEGKEVVRILLKLEPRAATTLERVTADSRGKQIAIVLGGEVVTLHKVRQVIKDGEVQITSCAVGAANYLFEQLEKHQANK